MQLTQLIYCSRATRPFTSDELMELGLRARNNNGTRGITGLLLYSAGNFIQLLEGDRKVISDLMLKIARDPRHTETALMHVAPARVRLFTRWRMGVLDLRDAGNLDRERMKALLGKIDAANAGTTLLEVLRDFRAQLPADDNEPPADASPA